jgi:hypothetical protein
MISSKTEEFLVGPIFLVNPMTPIFLVASINLVALIAAIDPVASIDSKNLFLIFKLKFSMRLDLIEVCILVPGGSFCCMSLMVFSNEH